MAADSVRDLNALKNQLKEMMKEYADVEHALLLCKKAKGNKGLSVEKGGKVDSLGRDNTKKRGPKAEGGPHNDKMDEIIKKKKEEGYTHENGRTKTEATIETPSGNKESRRADLTFKDPETGKIHHVNVGRSNKRPGSELGGVDPIKRERDALEDIRGSGETIEFVPYD